MIALALVASALAGDPQGIFTTVVQARPDMTGNPYVGVWPSGWAAMNQGTNRYEGYGELAFPSGIDAPFAPALYVLTADGRGDTMDWTLGRQRIALPTNPRLIDGGRFAWNAASKIRLEGWAGEARITGLGGWGKTVPLIRATATLTQGPWVAMVGAWGEAGAVPTEHGDLRVRWQDHTSKAFPSVNALAVVGSTGIGATVERARIEASMRPKVGVRTLVYVEHHDALPEEGSIGPSILEAFAPNGGQEAGVGVGWSDARRAQLWVQGSAQAWHTDALGEQIGFRTQAKWRPQCAAGTWCITPQWTAASGPGGFYHSFVANVAIPTPDTFKLSAYAAAAPYRKIHQPWAFAATLGAVADVAPKAKTWSLQFGGDVTRDAINAFDPRLWGAVRVRTQ